MRKLDMALDEFHWQMIEVIKQQLNEVKLQLEKYSGRIEEFAVNNSSCERRAH
jgi:hypothetical protein